MVSTHSGWGYSTSPASVTVGGFGEVSGSAWLQDCTAIDIRCVLAMTCNVTELHMTVTKSSGEIASAGDIKIKVVSETGGVYTVQYDIDFSAEFNALSPGCQTLVKTGNWAVQKGWMLGHYSSANLFTSTIHQVAGLSSWHAFVYRNGDCTDTFSSPATVSGRALAIGAYAATSECVLFDDPSGHIGEGGIAIPVFRAVPYYIVVETSVPDGESLEIQAMRNGNSAEYTMHTLRISYDGGNGDDSVRLYNGATYNPCAQKSIAGQEGDKITYHLWEGVGADASGELDRIDCLFCNYTDGQGPTGGDGDIKMVSITDRAGLMTLDDLETRHIRWLKFVNVGGHAAVHRVVVCRRPIVAVGDSYTSSCGGGVTVLARVGAALDDPGVFTERRYVINGGIMGNRVLADSTGWGTAIKTRFNQAASNQDLCAFRDAVYVFVNGPCTNDAGTATTQERVYRTVVGAAGAIGQMVYDAKAISGSDVVMTSLMPWAPAALGTDYNQWQADAVRESSALLKTIASYARVPFADFYNDYTGGWWSYNHPDDAGSLMMARAIATAYEESRMPGVLGGFDLDSDADVDCVDYAMFASNWAREDCSGPNSWCEGADGDQSSRVGFPDLMGLSYRWLEGAEGEGSE